MLRDPIELVRTRLTPSPAPGLQLATSGSWAFGLLSVEEPEASHRAHEAWARSIMLHAYADQAPGVRSRGLVGPRRLLVDPLPGRAAGGPLELPFAFDLHAWLGAGAWFVSATARDHAAAPRRVELTGPALDLGAAPTPAEALLLARTRLRADHVTEADALLGAALQDEDLKADASAGALFDAACAAARAGQVAEGQARHAAGARALGLLRDGVQRAQRALAAALQAHLLASLDGAPDERFDALLAQEVERLRWLREDDPDLASLRGSLAFAGVFKAPRRGATGSHRAVIA